MKKLNTTIRVLRQSDHLHTAYFNGNKFIIETNLDGSLWEIAKICGDWDTVGLWLNHFPTSTHNVDDCIEWIKTNN